LNFFLTGRKYNEYTNATTTSMLDANKKEVSKEIIEQLEIPSELMQKIIYPASKIGTIKEDIAKKLGIKSTDVIAVGSHDTASAIVAIPVVESNWAYLSSGTWSLLGIEINKPILTDKAREYSFTNEGGVDNTIRFLKNIMGLWILQGARLSWSKKEKELDYSIITKLAEKEKPFQGFINPDDERFFNPKDMVTEIKDYLFGTNQKVVTGIGPLGRVILESLAFKVAYYFKQLNSFVDEPIKVLHIVGGGSQNELLNQFIANACNVKVVSGPSEGTAAGNIMTQALSNGDVKTLSEIRKYIRNSYDIVEFKPEDQKEWSESYDIFLDKCSLS
jgi:rhamnulokinase